MHHIRTWWLASPVAMSLLGYGQDLNRDVLDKQSEQYQMALMGLTAFPEVEIVKPLLERQWLLQGILPAGLTYQIKWRNKQLITAATVSQATDAALKLMALGRPDLAAQVLALLLPGLDINPQAVPAVNTQQPGQAQGPETRARPARLAQVADELGQRIGSG